AACPRGVAAGGSLLDPAVSVDSALPARQRSGSPSREPAQSWIAGVTRSGALDAGILAAILLDHVVRPHQQRLRDGEAQRLRGLHVDYQLEAGRLFDGQIGGIRACLDLFDNRGWCAIRGE